MQFFAQISHSFFQVQICFFCHLFNHDSYHWCSTTNPWLYKICNIEVLLAQQQKKTAGLSAGLKECKLFCASIHTSSRTIGRYPKQCIQLSRIQMEVIPNEMTDPAWKDHQGSVCYQLQCTVHGKRLQYKGNGDFHDFHPNPTPAVSCFRASGLIRRGRMIRSMRP